MPKPAHLAAPSPHAVRGLALSLLVAAGWGLASTASAQTPAASDAASPYSLTLGLGVARLPEYEGADRFDVRALPFISYRSGRFFAGTLSGVGYNLSNTPEIEFGPVLTYRFGRDESDSPRLRGLGDIDAGADVGAFLRWNAQPFTLGARLERGLGGNVRGTTLRLDAGYALAVNRSNTAFRRRDRLGRHRGDAGLLRHLRAAVAALGSPGLQRVFRHPPLRRFCRLGPQHHAQLGVHRARGRLPTGQRSRRQPAHAQAQQRPGQRRAELPVLRRGRLQRPDANGLQERAGAQLTRTSTDMPANASAAPA